jgi:alkaline phosphatase D
VFLGDYIYEYASGGYSDPRGRLTGQDFECVTVDQYRARYALYRSDPLLRAAHAAVPWIVTWDDHEVDNDYADDVSEQDDPTADFLTRRAASYQVWYEHMPVRLDPPTGPDYEIYRSFAHGDLIRFHVLDTRQYRSDQQRKPAFLESIGASVQERDDALVSSPDQTMLGSEQLAWLVESAEQSVAIWDVLAQQVFMFGANAIANADPPIIVVDTWDGYAGEREQVLEALAATVDNLVVLTGDFHSAAVGQLRTDPFDLALPVVGTEFMASSISSGFFDDVGAIADLVEGAIAANPQIQWFDPRRGYTLCEVTPDQWRATYRAVADPFDESSVVETVSEWVVTAGTPGATRA